MNYIKLTKAQLIDVIQTRDECINELDRKISESTLQYKWEHFMSEGRLLLRDLTRSARYMYEQGIKFRTALQSLRQPLLKTPN